MNRWHADNDPQLTLPGSAACAFGTRSYVRSEQIKPSRRRRT